MSTVYTLNGKVLKNAANDKWLTKKELPPPPTVIQPDMVPDQSQQATATGYKGPGLSGDKLDYNTTYTINYPSGYNIRSLYIARTTSNWEWVDIDTVQPPPNTIKLSDYLTSSQWNDTNILYFNLLDNSSSPIYEPLTLTPVS